MKKVALSAMIAIVTTVGMFKGVLMAGGNVTDAATAVFAAAVVALVALVATTAATIAATVFATTAAAATATTAATIVTVVVAALVAVVVAALVAAELKIPHKWVFRAYAVEAATLSGVFLFPNLIPAVAITIAGCGLIAGIWRLYNYSHQLVPANSE